MDKKYVPEFELQEPERSIARENCLKQIAEWGLVMPDPDPILRHFKLNDFYRIGEIEFWLCNHHDQGYCSKFIYLFEDQVCPFHHHRIKFETFYIVRGKIEMTLDDEVRVMLPGEVLDMPTKTGHSFKAVGGPALVLEVSKPSIRHDSYFKDDEIGKL